MRPARPVVWEPVAVSAPLIAVLPSRNSGSCELPLVSDVTVEVADSEFTTLVVLAALTTFSKVPMLENWRLLPNAALSAETTPLMPPAKFTPMI